MHRNGFSKTTYYKLACKLGVKPWSLLSHIQADALMCTAILTSIRRRWLHSIAQSEIIHGKWFWETDYQQISIHGETVVSWNLAGDTLHHALLKADFSDWLPCKEYADVTHNKCWKLIVHQSHFALPMFETQRLRSLALPVQYQNFDQSSFKAERYCYWQCIVLPSYYRL